MITWKADSLSAVYRLLYPPFIISDAVTAITDTAMIFTYALNSSFLRARSGWPAAHTKKSSKFVPARNMNMVMTHVT